MTNNNDFDPVPGQPDPADSNLPNPDGNRTTTPGAWQPTEPYSPATGEQHEGQPADPNDGGTRPGQEYVDTATGTAYSGAGDMGPFANPDGETPRTNRGVIFGAIAVIVLVIALLTFFFIRNAFSANGSDSPDEAVNEFIAALESGDVIEAARMTSPVEVDYFTKISGGSNTDLISDEDREALENARDDILDSIEVGFEGSDPEPGVGNDQVQSYHFPDGAITIEVTDQEKFVGAIRTSVETFRDTFVSMYSDAQGLGDFYDISDDDIDEMMANVERGIAEDPTSEFSHDGELVIVTVKEGDEWYISPTMSMLSFGAWEDAFESDGTLKEITLPVGEGASSPQESVTQFLTAIGDGSVDGMYTMLPTVERRMLAQADAFLEDSGSSMRSVVETLDGMLSVDDLGLTTFDREGAVRVIPSSGSIGIGPDGDTYYLRFGNGRLAIEYGSAESADELYNIDISPITSEDVPLLGLSSIEESDGWHVSLGATVMDIFSIIGDPEAQSVLEDFVFEVGNSIY